MPKEYKIKLARYEPGIPKILLVISLVLVKKELSLMSNVKRDKKKANANRRKINEKKYLKKTENLSLKLSGKNLMFIF